MERCSTMKTPHRMSFTVRSISADTSFTIANLTINLTDVNESAISAISDSNAAADTVLENGPLGRLSVLLRWPRMRTGPIRFTYSLDDNAGGRVCDRCGDGVVTSLSDRSRGGCELRITIRATSTESSTSTSTRTITIGDVDEFDTVPVVDNNGRLPTPWSKTLPSERLSV